MVYFFFYFFGCQINSHFLNFSCNFWFSGWVNHSKLWNALLRTAIYKNYIFFLHTNKRTKIRNCEERNQKWILNFTVCWRCLVSEKIESWLGCGNQFWNFRNSTDLFTIYTFNQILFVSVNSLFFFVCVGLLTKTKTKTSRVTFLPMKRNWNQLIWIWE